MASTEISLRVANAIGDVAPEAWDGCANPDTAAEAEEPGRNLRGDPQLKPQDCAGELIELPAPVSKAEYDPFISHDFLSALERSGSVCNRTGWQPMHLVAQAADGKVVGEYAIPVEGSGARAIIAIPDGRLFFSAHDAGAIGEVIPRR